MTPNWCREADSNRRHMDFQSIALPLSYLGNETYFINSNRLCPGYRKQDASEDNSESINAKGMELLNIE